MKGKILNVYSGYLKMLAGIPKGIEDARLRQASEAPEP